MELGDTRWQLELPAAGLVEAASAARFPPLGVARLAHYLLSVREAAA
jgi:hypothetical protein